jgi:hypothetical protein
MTNFDVDWVAEFRGIRNLRPDVVRGAIAHATKHPSIAHLRARRGHDVVVGHVGHFFGEGEQPLLRGQVEQALKGDERLALDLHDELLENPRLGADRVGLQVAQFLGELYRTDGDPPSDAMRALVGWHALVVWTGARAIGDKVARLAIVLAGNAGVAMVEQLDGPVQHQLLRLVDAAVTVGQGGAGCGGG